MDRALVQVLYLTIWHNLINDLTQFDTHQHAKVITFFTDFKIQGGNIVDPKLG